MNWFHFLGWVAGLYLVYYLALILFDYARSKRPKTPDSGELTFTEDIMPKKIEHLPDKTESPPPKQEPKPGSPIIGSGGVSLKNLFGLCREEAIIYTRPVSF
jgi:hypothetical protein